MSYTKLATSGLVASELMQAISCARRELLLEIYQQQWGVAQAGVLTHKPTGACVPTLSLLNTLTDDSADPHYIHLVTHMMKCGWEVQPDGQISHRDGHGPMPVRLALIACLSVGSGV